tara:strand:+ start:2522 stop:2683 length:162 start_codon:yes stop_codon:yes gene_type:complete
MAEIIEQEEGLNSADGEVMEKDEVVEVEQDEQDVVDDRLNLDWGVLYTFSMYK